MEGSTVWCSGHGVCRSASYLAVNDYNNSYELWDKDVNFGCQCDPGYMGPNCAQRKCKVGFDPVLADHFSRRYANWTLAFLTTSATVTITGNYSIRFFDYAGQPWMTEAISYGAPCADLIYALEHLPRGVIPNGTVRCLQFRDFKAIPRTDEPGLSKGNPFYGSKYTLVFPGNPGLLLPVEVETILDGSRPTLFDNTPVAVALTTRVGTVMKSPGIRTVTYANGFSGETTDYFKNRCLGIEVTLRAANTYDYLSGLTEMEFRLLARCLGEADGIPTFSASARVEGQEYAWDYGSIYSPHIIKLVDKTPNAVTDICLPNANTTSFQNIGQADPTRPLGVRKAMCINPNPPGFYAALYYDKRSTRFILLNRPAVDYSVQTMFWVYTTKGTAIMTTEHAVVFTDPTTPYLNSVYTTNSTKIYGSYKGNVDCETTVAGESGMVSGR